MSADLKLVLFNAVFRLYYEYFQIEPNPWINEHDALQSVVLFFRMIVIQEDERSLEHPLYPRPCLKLPHERVRRRSMSFRRN